MNETPAGLTVHANIWVERDGAVVLSRWRAQLLAAVDATRSITGAAERMNIQYRLAWERLEEMEHGLGIRLVERHVGGAGGGGAQLTAAGRELVARFNHFAEQMDAQLQEEFAQVFGPDASAPES